MTNHQPNTGRSLLISSFFWYKRGIINTTPVTNVKSIQIMNSGPSGPGAERLERVAEVAQVRWRAAAANHYANSRPLCLTSNNSALYICKAWQDTVHTALLSKWSHARLVTPKGWPLSATRLLGQTSHFIQADTHTHTQAQVVTCMEHITSQGSAWQDTKMDLSSFHTQVWVTSRIIGFLEPLSVLLKWKELD